MDKIYNIKIYKYFKYKIKYIYDNIKKFDNNDILL
jgi:hypothetical protein